MITILADKHIPFLEEYIPDSCRLVLFDPDAGIAHGFDNALLRSVQALILRTVSRIDESGLPWDQFTSLKFIGTASAGFDHVDVDLLARRQIHFVSAGGSNANAVGEYVATGLLHWCLSQNTNPSGLKIGIIGAGHTGSASMRYLEGLGCICLPHDPPRELREPTFKGASKDEILDCDVLSFHVPLTKAGLSDFPTKNWLADAELNRFSGRLIINASRGGVVDESALMYWKERKSPDRDFILDVWENEPDFNPEVCRKAWIATPHIAGYSNQAKRNATKMVTDALIQYFNIPEASDQTSSIPETGPIHNIQSQAGRPSNLSVSPRSGISDILESMHPMFGFNRTLKSNAAGDRVSRAALFKSLRMHSQLRDEYGGVSDSLFDSFQEFPQIHRLISVAKGR